MRTPDVLRRVLAIFIGIALGCLAGEITLRLLNVFVSTSPLEPHPIVHHWHPQNLKFQFINPTGEYPGFPVEFNDVGMASSRELLPHEEGIVLLGDSFVEAGHIPEENRLSTLIERAVGLKTFNLGMPSFSPLLSRLEFDMFRDRITPRAVVHVIFSNDLIDDQTYRQAARVVDGRIVAVPGPSGLRYAVIRATRWLYFARLVANTLSILKLRWEFQTRLGALPTTAWSPYFRRPLPETELSDHLQFTEENIQLTADAARSAGSRFYLTTVPDRGAALQDTRDYLNDYMKDFAARSAIDYIDLVPEFRRAGVRSLYYQRDIHWNHGGYALAGRIIADRIRTDLHLRLGEPPW